MCIVWHKLLTSEDATIYVNEEQIFDFPTQAWHHEFHLKYSMIILDSDNPLKECLIFFDFIIEFSTNGHEKQKSNHCR